ncbi:unnamed protein product [Heligmosomoides polygyrus]|uniref:HTH_48 domain-containing protein n=1 Tax=Heligmosomoides polygyrus TaxID=6339 RepID=A0A183GLL5_HELPZ|nr:unnamed protein product [Heligmosomoides polygyrus]
MMAELSTHIRHVLLYEFESGHSAAEAYRNLCRVFGSESPSVRSVYSWFERFRSGNRSPEDEPRSGRPTTISLDELRIWRSSIYTKVCVILLLLLAVPDPQWTMHCDFLEWLKSSVSDSHSN